MGAVRRVSPASLGEEIPQCAGGDGVSVRKTQNTVLGMCGILVFWYSGLALAETRFLSWETAFLR